MEANSITCGDNDARPAGEKADATPGSRSSVGAAIRFHWPYVTAVLALAVFVRALFFGPGGPALADDSASYIATTKAPGLLSPMRTPGYPAWLALNFHVFGGDNLRAVALNQKALGVLSNLLLYVLFWRLTRSRLIAAFGAVSVILHVQIMAFEPRILTEALSLFVLSATAAWNVAARRRACSAPGVLLTAVFTSVLLLIKASFALVWMPFGLCLVMSMRGGLRYGWGRIAGRIALLAAVNLGVACGWSSVMHRHYGFRGLSNLLGVQLGHVIVARGLVGDIRPERQALRQVLGSVERRFHYLGSMDGELRAAYPDYDPVTRRPFVDDCMATIRGVPVKFARRCLMETPYVMGMPYYTFGDAGTCGATGWTLSFFEATQNLYYLRVGRYAWFLFPVILIPAMVVDRKNPLRLAGWLLVFLLVWYLVLVNCCLTYSEYGRHRAPVEPFLIGGLHAGALYLWVRYGRWRGLKSRLRRREGKATSVDSDEFKS